MDNNLATFELRLPKKTTPEQGARMFAALAGLYPRLEPIALHGRHTLVWEVLAIPTGIHYFLSFPRNKTDVVQAFVQSAVEGIRIIDDSAAHQYRTWKYGVRMRPADEPTEEDKKLKDFPKQFDPAAIITILSTMAHLQDGDAVMVQIVMTPTGHNSCFMADPRLVSTAPHDIRAHELMANTLAAFRHLQVFVAKPMPQNYLHMVSDKRAPFRWPLAISPAPLSVLAVMAFNGISVPGLVYSPGQYLIPEMALPTGPIVIGTSNAPGSKRAVGLSLADLTRHQHVIGGQGRGKSTFINAQMVQIAQQGGGFLLIDPHGDLAKLLISEMPSSRVNDVIVMDFVHDDPKPVGFNVLEGDPERVTGQIMTVFDQIFDIGKLAIAPNVLRAATLMLAYNKMSIVDMRGVLDPTEDGRRLRAKLAENVKNDRILATIKEWDGMTSQQFGVMVAPLLRKFDVFETFEAIYGVIGQTESAFKFDDVIRDNKIVIVHLSNSEELEETTNIIGSLILGKFISAARNREKLEPDQRTPYGLFIDEVHNFVGGTVSLANILFEMRKFGIGFTMAHQDMVQLNGRRELASAVLGNARNKVFFNVQYADAAQLAREVPDVTADMIVGLGQYEAIVRTVSNNQDMRAVTIKIPEPTKKSPGQLAARTSQVRAASGRLGMPIAEVKAGMKLRTTPPAKPSSETVKPARIFGARR